MKPFARLKGLLAKLGVALSMCLLLTACGTPPKRHPTATEESASASGGRPIFTQRTQADDRAVAYVWQEGSQFVRIEKAEADAGPHRHPASLKRELIMGALGRIRIGTPDGKRLFNEPAIEALASPLSDALANASADQEVTFAFANRSAGMGRLMSRRVTTGRLFMSDNGLNLIVGLLQTPFEDEMRATGYRIPFLPGSRNRRIQEGWSLAAAPPATHPIEGRGDWILIDFKTGKTGDTRTRAVPAAETTGATGSGDVNDSYHRLEHRLEVLKQWRDKGLISEDAYQRKSREILDEL
ncbi:MAG: hypothetical protein P8166_00075 [Candidatus Thiodiazotropha sp.]